MALLCINPPLVEPVSLSELKEMLRLDPTDTSQDNVLASLNVAARGWCETLSQRRFVQQTWRLLMDFFPGYIDMKLAGSKVSSPFVSGSNAVLVGIRYAIVLPYPPVQQIALFQYQDANGNVTPMVQGTSYSADLASQPARLTPPFGQMWPVARVLPNAVQVDFQVGYATPMQLDVTADGTVQLTGGHGGFTAANIGQPMSIAGVGPDLGTLNTVVQSVTGPVAALRDQPAAARTNVTALLVNYGIPAHWEIAKNGIKFLVNSWFVRRMPSFDVATRDAMRSVLAPIIDRRF
jgi:hypothetical protein